MKLVPLFINPISDFFSIILPQHLEMGTHRFCSDIESRLLDCVEAYGCLKARDKCAELMYDLSECGSRMAQQQRESFMRKERMRQYREGKLSKPFEEYPPLDIFLGI